jgi:transcription elongation GreA/GreB family factor
LFYRILLITVWLLTTKNKQLSCFYCLFEYIRFVSEVFNYKKKNLRIMPSTLKQQVYAQLLAAIEEKIKHYDSIIRDLSNSASNETKSTAGDKHETALAMLQAEQSRMATHLYEAIEAKTKLMSIDISRPKDKVQVGNLVSTDIGVYFIGIALPKVEVDGVAVFAISPQSPLAMQLMGKEVNDTVLVNGKGHCIIAIT